MKKYFMFVLCVIVIPLVSMFPSATHSFNNDSSLKVRENYEWWARTYGGNSSDWATCIQQTSDGGFIAVGTTSSFGKYADIWILKLDGNGSVEWEKQCGGNGDDTASSVQQTSDGGYIVMGRTNSFGAGNYDFWVLKLNSSGNIEWQKTYGGTGDDRPYMAHQTADGKYILVGYTKSFDSGYYSVWVLKLFNNGSVEWEKKYNNSLYDAGYAIQQTSDGGYIVAGVTYSGGVSYDDFWILKLHENGSVEWEKKYGGSANERPTSIQQTSDGGYIVAGYTTSFGVSDKGFWVLKITTNGSIQWQKKYDDISEEHACTIQQTIDGGYIVAGYTNSMGMGDYDFWILKLHENGTIAWQNSYGGVNFDRLSYLQQTSDKGYVAVGNTRSFGAGNDDFWVLKITESGEITFNESSGANCTYTTRPSQDTSGTSNDTAATIKDTSALVTDTSVVLQDTHCVVTTQAEPYIPPQPPGPTTPPGTQTEVFPLYLWIVFIIVIVATSIVVVLLIKRKSARKKVKGNK